MRRGRIDNTTKLEAGARRLDALALLLEGNGTCAAVAFDPRTEEMVIAYNHSTSENAALTKKYFQFFEEYVQRGGNASLLVENGRTLVLQSLRASNAQQTIMAARTPSSKEEEYEIRGARNTLETKIALYTRALVKIAQDLKENQGEIAMALRKARTQGSPLYAIIPQRSRSQHAELEVLDYFLKNEKEPPGYVGVSKLSCALCARCVEKVYRSPISEKPLFIRGTSDLNFGNVDIPESIMQQLGMLVREFKQQVHSEAPIALGMSVRRLPFPTRSPSPPADRDIVKGMVDKIVAELGPAARTLDREKILEMAMERGPIEPQPATSAPTPPIVVQPIVSSEPSIVVPRSNAPPPPISPPIMHRSSDERRGSEVFPMISDEVPSAVDSSRVQVPHREVLRFVRGAPVSTSTAPPVPVPSESLRGRQSSSRSGRGSQGRGR